MALTKIIGEGVGSVDTITADNLTIDTNTLYVDSANNRVGIGTSSPEIILHVRDTSAIMRLVSDTNSTSGVDFGDTADTNIGRLLYDHTDNSMRFTTNTSERMRIDSSGNLLVGGTNSTPGAGNTVAGASIYNDGRIFLSKSGNTVASFSRNTSDGAIAEFRKDGSTVGSIGNNGTELFIGTPSGSGGYIRLQSLGIVPATNTGANSDGTMQLGTASGRFTDLYLSNSVRLKGATRDISIQQDNYGLRVYDNDASSERFRIDAAGNVGIGTSSPSEKLEINSGTGNIGAKIVSTDSLAVIAFKDNSTTDVQYLGANGDNLVFHAGTTPSERMRIDSSGNLLVGTTDNSPYNNTTNTGFAVSPDGYFSVARAGVVGYFNRITSNGDIVAFRKDGINVGTIGTQNGSDFYITGTASDDTGLRFQTNEIVPVNDAGGNRDNAIDLGKSNIRFKDLYLSTTAYATTLAGVSDTNTFIRFEGSDVMTFRTGNSERMRIDSSGNLLVGTTNANPAENNVAGIGALANNTLSITRDGSAAMQLNRKTSDGSIVILRRDGTTKGSIGTQSDGRTYIANADMGITFNQTNYIMPSNGSGAENDNSVDLGKNNSRFKDLYLSGGAYIGGTGSANYLDDYEEGTWTPSISTGTSYASQIGHYTKIGNVVHIKCNIEVTTLSAVTNELQGLPFSASNTGQSSGAVNVMYYSNINEAVTWLSGYVINATSNIYFTGNTGSAAITIGKNAFNIFKASTRILFSCTYRTA